MRKAPHCMSCGGGSKGSSKTSNQQPDGGSLVHRNPELSCEGAMLLACRRLSPRRALVKDLDLVVQLEALSPQLGVRFERAFIISMDTGGAQRSRLPMTTRVRGTSTQLGATTESVPTISSTVRVAS